MENCRMKKFLMLILLLVLSIPLFGFEKIYEDNFDKRKGFLQTYQCSYHQGEFHIFNAENGFLCWQDLKKQPANSMIRAIVITQDKENLDDDQNAGIIFRVKNVNQAALFAVFPKNKIYQFGYWDAKVWNSIQKKYSDAIKDDINYIDVVSMKDNLSFYVNGIKVLEEKITQKTFPESGNYTGFYSSKKMHAHFERFEIFELDSKYVYQPPLMNYVKKPLEEDMPKDIPAYDDIEREIYSNSFDRESNNPFVSNLNAHIEQGKYQLWNKNGHRAWNSTYHAQNALVETAAWVAENRAAVGVLLKQDSTQYYSFTVNPFTGVAELKKNKNGKETLFLGSVVPQIKKGEGVKNTIALGMKGKILTPYINGERLKSVEDPAPLYGDGFGLISDGDGKAEFDYVRFFELKKSLWEKISGFLKFLIFVIVIVLLVKLYKKRKRNRKKNLSRENIIKDILKGMKSKKKKIIYDSELIFEYQITKKEADEILSDLSLNYGGFFDYAKDGRTFCSFEVSLDFNSKSEIE